MAALPPPARRAAARRPPLGGRGRGARAAREPDEAVAALAVAAAPDRPPKANTTHLASQVMPLKKGGSGGLYNLQALAGRGQGIFAIGTHPGTAGAALHLLLAAGTANLAAARITGRIGNALFDAGYAGGDAFTAPCQADLYVAVTRESRRAGKLATAGPRPAASPAGRPGSRSGHLDKRRQAPGIEAAEHLDHRAGATVRSRTVDRYRHPTRSEDHMRSIVGTVIRTQPWLAGYAGTEVMPCTA